MDFSFETLSFKVRTSLKHMGYFKPTPVQEKIIPIVLSGMDVVGLAETGTGKTAAFAIPLIERIEKHMDGVKALVLTPTRELAIQVAEEIARIGKQKGVKAFAFYGGVPLHKQISILKRDGAKIVVGTPGRIKDLIEREALVLDNISFLVLDEVDRMLDMGFIEDIDFIISYTPLSRQTLFFSATISKDVRKLMKSYLKEDFELISVRSETFRPQIEEKIYKVKHGQRFEALCRILKNNLNGGSCIVFVKTKLDAAKIGKKLKESGFSADCIHGDLSQRKREMVMGKFKRGKIKTLVATDVAARGIDVKSVELVINYELPEDPEMYIHRIGRTARAGSKGLAVSFVTFRERQRKERIPRIKNTPMQCLI